ncbi:OmpH family outer membrane protein [Sphingoaurantiacus capsulatus]|uniref:OmpH family outer membrane protein n=1 Tax=Sphingoaurantiacus capsulatus TaxID=1771310 RepID=A0ABV7XDP9_9SPHN
MKTMFKAAAIAALALGSSTAALAQAAAPAGANAIIVVDMDRVGADSAAGKSGQQQLKTQLDSLQARGKSLADSLRGEEQTLLKAQQGNTMAPEAFQAKVKDLQTKQNTARTELGNREQGLQRNQGYVRQQIFNAVGPIINAVMRERGASLVIARDAALAVSPTLDVTAEVIRRLDAALPRVNATAPAVAPAAAPAKK